MVTVSLIWQLEHVRKGVDVFAKPPYFPPVCLGLTMRLWTVETEKPFKELQTPFNPLQCQVSFIRGSEERDNTAKSSGPITIHNLIFGIGFRLRPTGSRIIISAWVSFGLKVKDSACKEICLDDYEMAKARRQKQRP